MTASIKLPLAPHIRVPDQISPVGDSPRMLGFSEIFGVIRRRLRLIASVVLLGTALSIAFLLNAPKSYKASSMVVLERNDTRPFAIDSSLKTLDRDRSAADTELDVLTSRIFAGRVIDKLNLMANPDFNTYLKAEAQPDSIEPGTSDGFFSTVVDKVKSLFRSEKTSMPSLSFQRDRTISNFLSRLSVSRTGESLAVTVAVEYRDAQLAADMANTVANLYVESSLELKRNDRITENTSAAANEDISFLRDRVTQPLLITLRSEEARLLRERAEIASSFGKNHPKMLNANAEIASVRAMIDQELQRVMVDLQSEAAKPSARMVSLAEVPTSPYFPKPTLIIAGGFVGSSVLAALLAVMLEISDTRIRGSEQLRRVLRIPNLASIPYLAIAGRKQNPNVVDFAARFPQSDFAEAMRSLYVACRIPNSDRLHSVIAFTSCSAGEGATTTALGLAHTAAADGQRTLILDLDLHRCATVKALKLQLIGSSLDRYLRGECEVLEIVHKVPNCVGLDIVGCIHQPKAPGSLLNSSRLRALFEALRRHYDVIVIDTPPILSVDDVNWLSPLLDAVILVVSCCETKEETVNRGAARLQMSQAPLLGTVLNKVTKRAY